MYEITLEATVKNLPKITAFIEKKLEEIGCSMKSQMQILLAIDEIFTNISMYAYKEKIGDATVIMDVEDDPRTVVLTFIDKGQPYDPTKKEDPDINIPVDLRPIGGLGIFLVKKTMDQVDYEYKEGKNILRLKKYI